MKPEGHAKKYLKKLKDYKSKPHTFLSELNHKQRKQILEIEGFNGENEAIFGSKKQFKRYAIDFVSTDKKKIKEAEKIYEIIFNKVNKSYKFKLDKLDCNRMFKQILNDVLSGNLNVQDANRKNLNDFSEGIQFWIKKGQKKDHKNTKKVLKILTIKQLEINIAKINKEFPRKLTSKKIQTLLEKYEKENENIEPKSRMIIAKALSRNTTIVQYIKELAGYRCEICGKLGFEKENGERYAEVHHIDELAQGGPDLPSNIICVCPSCHKKFHYGSEKVKKNLKLKRKLI